ncbi:SPIN-like protein [Mya arenaria]|uniref:SPIN-like protein n=1 Tax=Mya arenaria TaxID=6604 RepID=A0ABY7DWY3_MYAAR|nr:SPIN-like protein [Mya arenaria]
MSNYDSNLTPPFDDSVQLSEMQVDVSDDLPIDAAGGDMELPEVEIVENTNHISTKRGYVIVAILFFINLLNYMDRFTIAVFLGFHPDAGYGWSGGGQLLDHRSHSHRRPVYWWAEDKDANGLLLCHSSWQVTPLLGIVCVGLILILVREPVRGGADGAHHLVNTSFFTDLKEIAKNKSFMLSSFGFTCVAFTVGALALWAPIFMQDAMSVLGHPTKASTVSFIFGGITVAAGFIGVAIGAESSRRYKLINPRADPLICAMGLLVLIFFGEVALCLNWAIIADILLYVVIPTRRSTAEAVQILMSHLLGDAGSPYLIGVMADGLSKGYKGNPSSPAIQFVALQQSLC